MRVTNKKTLVLLICLVSFALLSGCTNWKKKYEGLNVENENTRGLLDRERTEKGQLAEQVTQNQQTIDELQKQIGVLKKSPAEATGFGPGYDVKFNAAEGTITVTLPDAILFDSGKVELKKASIAELDHIQSVVREKYASRQIDVVGHTDTDPIKKSKWADNLELSGQRAFTVSRYLIKRGISDDKIRAIGCGEGRPIASNATAAGKSKNRRVEIVVHMR
jgi:chemotaxis protein MotB